MDEKTYKIIRFHKDISHPDNHKIIKEGLTLKEAQDHCKDPRSMSSPVDLSTCDEECAWFDGYEEED
jgi:hypothetical protein